MSNRVIDAVKDFSKTKGSERLLLVMIADGINKSTGVYEAFISTLMADCNMSERWVQKLIVRLVETGELIVFERTGHNSSFAIPIYEGELGYAPQPCDSEQHLCIGYHTPLSVDRENIRRDEYNANRRQQRTSRRVKKEKGVNGSAPLPPNDDAPLIADTPQTTQRGERECTPPRPIVHPPVNDSTPRGEREYTHYPSSYPLDLPIEEPNAHARDDLSIKKNQGEGGENGDAEPGPPTPPTPPPSVAPAAPHMPPSYLWSRVYTRLRQSMTEAQIASWISPAHIASYGWDDDGQLLVHLETPGRAQADMIERKYSYIIAAAIGGVMGIPASRVTLEIAAVAHVQASHVAQATQAAM